MIEEGEHFVIVLNDWYLLINNGFMLCKGKQHQLDSGVWVS